MPVRIRNRNTATSRMNREVSATSSMLTDRWKPIRNTVHLEREYGRKERPAALDITMGDELSGLTYLRARYYNFK